METPQTPPRRRAIDQIRRVFSHQMSEITVPEWADEDGTPLSIFFAPMTVADFEVLQLGSGDPADGESVESFHDRNLRLVLHKARDKEGRPLFESGDILTLKREAHYPVVQRVISFMYTCGSLTPQRAEEEIKNDQGSTSTST